MCLVRTDYTSLPRRPRRTSEPRLRRFLEDRLPIRSGGLHAHQRHLLGHQPIPHRQQIARHRRKRPHFSASSGPRRGVKDGRLLTQPFDREEDERSATWLSHPIVKLVTLWLERAAGTTHSELAAHATGPVSAGRDRSAPPPDSQLPTSVRYVDRVPQRVWRCRCRPPVKAHGVAGLASSSDASFPALCSLSARTVSPDVTGCSGKANRERWRLATTTSMSPEHVCGLRIPTVLTARSRDVDRAFDGRRRQGSLSAATVADGELRRCLDPPQRPLAESPRPWCRLHEADSRGAGSRSEHETAGSAGGQLARRSGGSQKEGRLMHPSRSTSVPARRICQHFFGPFSR